MYFIREKLSLKMTDNATLGPHLQKLQRTEMPTLFSCTHTTHHTMAGVNTLQKYIFGMVISWTLNLDISYKNDTQNIKQF